jgi:hypothetical protein
VSPYLIMAARAAKARAAANFLEATAKACEAGHESDEALEAAQEALDDATAETRAALEGVL